MTGTRGILFADGGDQLQAVHVGHLQVGQDKIRDRPADLLQGLFATAGVIDGIAGLVLQDLAGQRAINCTVINNQNSGHGVTSWAAMVATVLPVSIRSAKAAINCLAD